MSLINKASLILTPNSVKEGKIHSIIPSNGNGDMSFVRATTANRGNELGLIEDSPYNLLKYSEDLANISTWTPIETIVTSNSEIAPNGKLTADTLTMSTNSSRVSQGLALGAGTYTISVWAKSITGAGSLRQLVTTDSGNVFFSFTPTNEWQKYEATFSVASFCNGYQLRSVNFIGLVSFWGAQLVAGTTAKPYFPTTDRLNVPRLNYDVAGGCPTILLEPQRTNLVLQSEDFSAVNWIPTTATITTNTDISPSGLQNADRLTANAGFSQIQSTSIVAIGSTYTVSFWIKRISGTGQVSIRAIENVNTPITITNQWVRYSVTATASSTIGRIGVNLITSGDVISIWGAQLELGAYATSYIPTLASVVTRNADIISRNNIYSNGLITSAGGTWFVELNNNFPNIRDGASRLGIGNSTSLSSEALFLTPSTTGRILVYKAVSGVSTALYNTLTDIVKIAIKWNGATADVFVNGVKVVSETLFTTTILEYFLTTNTTVPIFIKQSLLFPTPLSDTELTQLTTL